MGGMACKWGHNTLAPIFPAKQEEKYRISEALLAGKCLPPFPLEAGRERAGRQGPSPCSRCRNSPQASFSAKREADPLVECASLPYAATCYRVPSCTEAASSLYHPLPAQDVISLSVYKAIDV